MSFDSISFCCILRNEEKYIHQLIKSLLEASKQINRVEFIFIDDFSNDKTFEILKEYRENDSRFQIYINSSKGKVNGTNLAFSKAKFDFVKFIDGDDLITENLANLPSNFNCLYHDYLEMYEANKEYKVVGKGFSQNARLFREEFRSIPKAMFFFKKSFLESYFPIPAELPFEDLWINFAAAEDMTLKYLPKALYIYRQHDDQYYGSLSNFNSDKQIRMATRFKKYYEYLENNKHPFSFNPKKKIKFFYKALLKEGLINHLFLIISPRLFIKSIIYSFPKLTRLIWKKI
mgnify:CR=1 FL=1